MATRDTSILVFIARASGSSGPVINKIEKLRESLSFVEAKHAESHDIGECPPSQFYPFLHGANARWRPTGSTVKFFEQVAGDAHRQGRPVRLIISGWNGLTTHEGSFKKLVELFKQNGVVLTLRIYAEDPRQWFDVNPYQVYDCFDGRVDLGDEGVEWDFSTDSFIRKFLDGHLARLVLSQGAQAVSESRFQEPGLPKTNRFPSRSRLSTTATHTLAWM